MFPDIASMVMIFLNLPANDARIVCRNVTSFMSIFLYAFISIAKHTTGFEASTKRTGSSEPVNSTSPMIPRSYLTLAIPVVLSMVVTLIYNLADTFFVARTNSTALVAGVSLGAPVFTALMAIGNIFGQGGSVLISRLIGQNDTDNAERTSSFCFYITFFLGIIIAFLMLLFRIPILGILGADSETFKYASDYYIPLAIGAPFIMLSFIHSNLLRSEGLSKESMIGTAGGAIVNIILDPIMISGLGWGASGAAIATVIGYIFSDAVFLVMVKRKSRILSVSIRKLKLSSSFIRQIVGIGIPAAIANMMQGFTAVMTNQYLLPYGNDKIAAMGIVLKVSMIALLILTGLAFGGQPLYGYYFGRGDKKRLSELFRFTLVFILSVAVVLTVLIIVLSPFLMGIFMDAENIIKDGTFMLRAQVITMPLVALVLLFTIIFQSAGKVVGSFVLSISRQGVIFFIVLVIGNIFAGYIGVVATQAVSDIITSLIAIILFRVQLAGTFRWKFR